MPNPFRMVSGLCRCLDYLGSTVTWKTKRLTVGFLRTHRWQRATRSAKGLVIGDAC